MNQQDFFPDATCPYSKVILEKYERYPGRIGISCDKCNIKDCQHSALTMSPYNLAKDYAFNVLKWEDKDEK